MASEGITEQIAGFALTTRFADLDGDVVHATKRVILDTVACIVGGMDTQIGRDLLRLKVDQGGVAQSTVMVGGERLPLASVAYLHGMIGNAMDSDDTLLHHGHIATAIVGPAIAAAELVGASGEDVIAAVAVGYDVAARICVALPAYSSRGGDVRFAAWGHSWAVFGAVAAVGRLLGLDARQLANAFAIGFMHAPLHIPGHWVPFPAGVARPMTKYSNYGQIAEAAISGTLLAAGGFTGNHRILDPEQEFWVGFGTSGYDWDVMLAELGTRWFVQETSFKTYPFGRQANIPIDLLLRTMREQGLSADEIDRVVVSMPPTAIARELSQEGLRPMSQLDASFNLRYALAAAAAGLPPGPQWLDEANVNDMEMRAFEAKIEFEARDDWQDSIREQLESVGYFLRIPTRVVVHGRGSEWELYSEHASGDPQTPETYTSDEGLTVKFKEWSRYALGEAKATEAAGRILSLEREPSMGALVASLVAVA